MGLEGQDHRLGLVQIACNGSIVEQPVAQRPISRLAGQRGRLCNARVSLLILSAAIFLSLYDSFEADLRSAEREEMLLAECDKLHDLGLLLGARIPVLFVF